VYKASNGAAPGIPGESGEGVPAWEFLGVGFSRVTRCCTANAPIVWAETECIEPMRCRPAFCALQSTSYGGPWWFCSRGEKEESAVASLLKQSKNSKSNCLLHCACDQTAAGYVAAAWKDRAARHAMLCSVTHPCYTKRAGSRSTRQAEHGCLL
jgi:hypothetical protein